MPGRGGRRRGRRRLMRFIEVAPPYTFYSPPLPPFMAMPPVDILPEEIEAMRLVDLLGLTQEEAAHRMGISKRAFWEDLKSGRKKVIQAIMEGRPIRILPAPKPPPPAANPTTQNQSSRGRSSEGERGRDRRDEAGEEEGADSEGHKGG